MVSRSFFSRVHSRMVGSQIIEDGFNEQKNVRPWKNRRTTVESAYHTLITRKALSAKHKFEDIPLPQAAVARGMKLDQAMYKTGYKEMPKMFRVVTSVKQKAEWPSPKAEDRSPPPSWTWCSSRRRSCCR